MTRYVKTDGGTTVIQYPYSVTDLRIEQRKKVSFPRDIPPGQLRQFNVFEVTEVSQPGVTDDQIVEEGAPELVLGEWRQTWNIRAKTGQEKSDQIRRLEIDFYQQARQRLDVFAQERNYSGYLEVLGLDAATVTLALRQEATAVRGFLESTHVTLRQMFVDIRAAARPVPQRFSDIEPELPALTWP